MLVCTTFSADMAELEDQDDGRLAREHVSNWPFPFIDDHLLVHSSALLICVLLTKIYRFLLWTISGVPFGVYAITQNLNIPIQAQAQVFMALCGTTWAQCLHYSPSPLVARLPQFLTTPLHVTPKLSTPYPNRGLSTLATYILTSTVLGIAGGIQAALIITLRPIHRDGDEVPIMIIGIIAAVLLAAGLLPPYWEIWKRKGRVMGISWWFLGIDWMGAFFSLMSLIAQNTFDIVGGVQYCVCLALETGLMVAGTVDWLVHRKKKKKKGTGGEEGPMTGGDYQEDRKGDEVKSEQVSTEGEQD